MATIYTYTEDIPRPNCPNCGACIIADINNPKIPWEGFVLQAINAHISLIEKNKKGKR